MAVAPRRTVRSAPRSNGSRLVRRPVGQAITGAAVGTGVACHAGDGDQSHRGPGRKRLQRWLSESSHRRPDHPTAHTSSLQEKPSARIARLTTDLSFRIAVLHVVNVRRAGVDDARATRLEAGRARGAGGTTHSKKKKTEAPFRGPAVALERFSGVHRWRQSLNFGHKQVPFTTGFLGAIHATACREWPALGGRARRSWRKLGQVSGTGRAIYELGPCSAAGGVGSATGSHLHCFRLTRALGLGEPHSAGSSPGGFKGMRRFNHRSLQNVAVSLRRSADRARATDDRGQGNQATALREMFER